MQREVEIKYKVLRGGADFCELYALENGGNALRMSDAAAIKTSLSGYFVPDDQIDWLTDEIQPILVIDGEEHPLGVYLPATVIPEENETTRSVRVTAYDRCWRVRDTYAASFVYFAAGTNYLTAIEQLLTACGIGLVIKTPTTAVFQEAREDWEPGASYLDIVNGLLAEISYNPLWFNDQGAAVLEPASIPTAENIEHVLDDSDVTSLLLPQISRETDVYSAPNVFVCVCSNADKSAPLVATAANTNPQSPLSTIRRGRQIVRFERVNNIEDLNALQAYADRLRNESMISGETIRVTTGLLPGFGVADVTALRYGELSAICVEHAWEMELKVGGSMKHTLERVVVDLG